MTNFEKYFIFLPQKKVSFLILLKSDIIAGKIVLNMSLFESYKTLLIGFTIITLSDRSI